MVTTSKKASSESGATGADFADTVKGSAQQIWLAGLGAFAKAQEEGSKVFDTLVREGVSMQRKTQNAAGEKLSEATARMASMASGMSSKATGQWDKLETIFEDRVSKALVRLGVPTAKDLEALSGRIEELNRHLSKAAAKSTATRQASEKTARQAAAKRKPPRKTA